MRILISFFLCICLCVNVQIGAPVKVAKMSRADITPADVDRVHAEFVTAMTRLFERTKHKHGVAKDVRLAIC